MSEPTALTVVRDLEGGERPTALMGRATDVAAVCRDVVLKLAVDIKGKRYLPVEAWCTIATAYGCVPSIREVTEEERGIRAVAELRKHDGTVLATAEGYVGLDEPTWANRPLFARRAMAQTRAVSRVCRSAFAFVVSLMDAGLSTTPREEIDTTDPSDTHTQTTAAAPVVDGKRSAPGDRSPKSKMPWGKFKGKYLCDIDDDDELRKFHGAMQKAVAANDPKWARQNEERLAAIEAEISRRKS